MEPETVKEHTMEKDSDEIETGTTATDRNVDSMACSDETITIGTDGLFPVEESYKDLMVTKYNKKPAGERDETGAIKDHDINLDQESHETSTTAEHDLHLTEEPAKTSTSADHEKKPAKEPDETSNTADLGTNPVGSPNNQNIGIKPFNLLGCPDNVLQQILRLFLVSDEQIMPYWNFGAFEETGKDARKENFAPILVAFAGNKKLTDEATTILYGENIFNLQHAEVSMWWLKRIGSNVSKIKHLVISVEEGLMVPFGIRFESLWYSIFVLLRAQQKLRCLEVYFAHWTDQNDKVVLEPRYRLIRTLVNFRGLVKAIIRPGPWLNEWTAGLLQDAVVMSPGKSNNDIDDLEDWVKISTGPKYYF